MDVDIELYWSAACERRQSDISCSIRTLNELRERLITEGFQISKIAAYTRLMPKRNVIFITTIPVKLIQAQHEGKMKHTQSTLMVDFV